MQEYLEPQPAVERQHGPKDFEHSRRSGQTQDAGQNTVPCLDPPDRTFSKFSLLGAHKVFGETGCEREEVHNTESDDLKEPSYIVSKEATESKDSEGHWTKLNHRFSHYPQMLGAQRGEVAGHQTDQSRIGYWEFKSF